MSFKSLGLSAALVKAVSKKGYTIPSPIQAKAIPVVLEGKDVLASAQTGTGKTAGFTLPMLQILSQNPPARRRRIRALVLTPTRELAAQVQDNVKTYSEFMDIKSTVVFGGVGANPQIKALRNGVDILVATPGRLLDLYNQRIFTLSDVEIFVLDEADRMLDMGFLRDIKRVISYMPEKRQNLLFSATFSEEIKRLASRILRKPVMVNATPENSTAEKVNQTIYRVDKGRKLALMTKLISEGNWKQVLVFTRTKHRANRLSEKLKKSGITAAAIHGNKSQNSRTKALAGFKSGEVHVLVATDIAARGLDIPLLPYVINYELPNVAKDYVHRIGRTGRAGASGEAISLVCHEEVDYVKGIEKLLKLKLPGQVVEGFEPSAREAQEQPKEQNNRRPSRKPRPKAKQGQGNNFNRSKRNNSRKKSTDRR